MAPANSTANELPFLHQQIFYVDFDAGIVSKIVVVVLISLLFSYVNCIMLVALWSKPVFQETPRYILFAYMLFNDSVLLLVTAAMYLMSVTRRLFAMEFCFLIILMSASTFNGAPLTLTVMSLERYVAICFPLRHCTIATQKSTVIALGLIWVLSSLSMVTDIIYLYVTDLNLPAGFCIRSKLVVARWQALKNQALDGLYFVSVTVIILFTYISIMVTARSVSSDKESAKKAQRTVLLHLGQLGLCLTSFLYAAIDSLLVMLVSNTLVRMNLNYLNFLIVVILPRCPSPLIYGLRDAAVRPLFKYYLFYGSGKVKPLVNIH